MLSLQEVLDKTTVQRKAIRNALDCTSKTKGWTPQDAGLYDGLKPADAYAVKETMDSLSLAEVLIAGSAAMGADDLVAAKLHDTLIYSAQQEDLCPLMGDVITGWGGANLTVDVSVHGSYKPKPATSAGVGADVNPSFVQCTLAPKTYTVPILSGNDMIEDSAYSLIQWHVEQAGKACGSEASELALAVLIAAPDGDGTLNTGAAGADTTTWAQILLGISTLGDDRWTANTMFITAEAWRDAIAVTAAALPGIAGKTPMADVYDLALQQLDLKFVHSPQMHAAGDLEGAVMTDCKTLIFNRPNAIITGRKRWLEIRNYADPIADIAGAVVSFRQDSVTLYKDAIYLLTES
jgi:hypothetical protein